MIPLLSVISCSKDDKPIIPDVEESKLKLDVEYTGDVESFFEVLTLQVVSSNTATLNIDGIDMNKEQPTNEVIWFSKKGVDIVPSQSYSTTEKASAITLSVVLTPKVVTAGKTITANVKFYSDSKLVETKQFTATSDQSNTQTVTLPFIAK